MIWRFSILAIAGAAVLAFSLPALGGSIGASSDTGQYIQYDVPGAAGTDGEAVNKHGTITGIWSDASDNTHGFVRAPDGTITTFDPKGAMVTFPVAINERGEIAGYYQTPDFALHGFLRKRNGKVMRLGSEGIGFVTAINNYGNICGTLTAGQAFTRAADGTLTEIDPAGATSSYANGINDVGTVAGGFKDTAGHRHGFVRAPDGTITTFDAPNAVNTSVYGMNAKGVVVGPYTDAGGAYHGYVRDVAGNITEFPLAKDASIADVYGMKINSKGIVIGYFPSGQWQHLVAFRRKPGGGMAYLKPSGAYQLSANGINDDGVIVGDVDFGDGVGHGYLRLP